MTQHPPPVDSIAPITFEQGDEKRELRICSINAGGYPTVQHVAATPADLLAAGFTPNAECARVLNELQQGHVREISAVRGELERAKAEKTHLRFCAEYAQHFVNIINRVGHRVDERDRRVAARDLLQGFLSRVSPPLTTGTPGPEQPVFELDQASAPAPAESAPAGAKCKYCNRVDCESERHRDDSRLLRMCRHAVQLERDFLVNRVGRLESALKETAPTEEDFPPFGVDPADSAALLKLRSAIDDADMWPSVPVKESGDYEAAVKFMVSLIRERAANEKSFRRKAYNQRTELNRMERALSGAQRVNQLGAARIVELSGQLRDLTAERDALRNALTQLMVTGSFGRGTLMWQGAIKQAEDALRSQPSPIREAKDPACNLPSSVQGADPENWPLKPLDDSATRPRPGGFSKTGDVSAPPTFPGDSFGTAVDPALTDIQERVPATSATGEAKPSPPLEPSDEGQQRK